LILVVLLSQVSSQIPVVVNTWPFTAATAKAWSKLQSGGSSLDAVEEGCKQCEIDRCDGSVGYGGSPDENGETTLDSMIMDGKTMKVGAVGCLRRIKNAISVARYILEHTQHTLLVGDLATKFAIQMGFKEESLTTNDSIAIYQNWKNKNCQPNFWNSVTPDSNQYCGPYKPLDGDFSKKKDMVGHDTIGIVVIDKNNHISSGASTNGLTHKIPGRVGDSPIMGAGSYADNEIGGCGATGDGDVMMRFLPCFYALEQLKLGLSPKEAAEKSIIRIVKYEKDFNGAIVLVDKYGVIGAACHNWVFQYSYINNITQRVIVETVQPLKL